MAFLPSQEIVRAPRDIERTDGSVAVLSGTMGVVEGRDDLLPDIYWVKFEGASDAIAVREGEVAVVPGRREARALVVAAMDSVGGRSCAQCEGPLVLNEDILCRHCADGDLDAAVEADLEPGPDGTPAKPNWNTPLDA